MRSLNHELLLGRTTLLSFEGPGVQTRFVVSPTDRPALQQCDVLFVPAPSFAERF